MLSVGVGSNRVVPCCHFCLLFSSTESRGKAEVWRVFGLVTSGSHFCCLQMMWFSAHWDSFQQSVKQWGGRSPSPNLNSGLLLSGWEKVTAPSGGVQTYWGFVYEWGSDEEIDRGIGGVSAVMCRCYTGLLYWRGTLARRSTLWFTSWSTLQTSHIITSGRMRSWI